MEGWQDLAGPLSHGLNGIVGTIKTALWAVWRFVAWSESRWMTVGCCSRSMVAAFHTGVADLVAFIMEDETARHFYINGFSRLTPRPAQFLGAGFDCQQGQRGGVVAAIEGCEGGSDL